MIRRFLSLWSFVVLLTACVSVQAESKSPLADAVEKQDAPATHSLLQKGVDVNSAQADGMTALHWAVHHDDGDSVKSLVEANANVNATNEYGVTPLSLACMNGSAPIAEILLKADADPKATLPGGETPLMTASRTGRLAVVELLLEQGVDVNARERKDQTAIMWAAAEGHVDVVDVLLKAGADFQTPLRSGFTPLFFAVREGRTEVVHRLLQAGADVNETRRPPGQHRGGTTAVILATENGHFELAVSLLDAGADANAHPSGFTALHAMTWVRKPIRGDGDPPPAGSGKLSSLDFVRQLVAKGADVNARLERGTSGRGRFTTTGSTAFVLAARASDVPLMQLLVDLGCDIQLPNSDNCPALLAASGVGALGDGDETAGTEAEAVAAVELLLKLGADVNALDENGETAMHGAAYQSWPEVVRLLVRHGADVKIWNQKNKSGWTPLLIAEGHRPGNFRPAPDTIAAVQEAMRAAGIDPPAPSQNPAVN